VYIPEIFFRPDRLIIRRRGESDVEVYLPYDGNGYIHEVRHVEDCLARGLTESPIMPLSDSLEILRITDELRHRWGVLYPGEEETHESKS
jgi:hypothetical protein